MKNLMLSFCLLCFLNPSVSVAQIEKSVKTTVQRATIFQQGALLSSTELVSVNAGTTNIIFENVSPYLQQNSLQAAGKNDLVIMDVQYRLKYAEQTKTDVKLDDPRVMRWREELGSVKDSLDDLSFVKKDIQNRINTLQTERNVLINNRMMRGDLQRDSLALFMQSKTIPAVYSYSVVPKLDPDAFLMARVTDWEDMNLIPGTARIYFDNSYIGESFINPRNTNDTLQLNLGRDKSIVVSRTKVKDKCKDKVMSDNHLLTQVYDITVRNTKTIPIRLVIEDQMPVTKEQDIKIEYLENSGARFNTETGKLVWDFNLKPKDCKKLTFSYEVKSPKDKSLSSL